MQEERTERSSLSFTRLCDNITENPEEKGYTVDKQEERSYPLWQL